VYAIVTAFASLLSRAVFSSIGHFKNQAIHKKLKVFQTTHIVLEIIILKKNYCGVVLTGITKQNRD
jgi:hypothetical protein